MRRLVPLVAASTIVFMAVATPASAAVVGDPWPDVGFTVSPVAGPAGTPVTVRGQCPSEGSAGVTIRSNPRGGDVISAIPAGRAETSRSGRFTISFQMPRFGSESDVELYVSCDAGDGHWASSSAPFTYTDRTTGNARVFTALGQNACGRVFFGGGPYPCEAHVKGFAPDGAASTTTNFVVPDWHWGASVAAGSVDRTGAIELAVGTGPGQQSRVVVLDASQKQLFNQAVFGDFAGGVNVALGDIDGDGSNDLIVGAGRGGGPHVRAFRFRDGVEIASFFAYDASFTGGVYVAAGDLDGDGHDEIITGPGAGGGPHVRAFGPSGGSKLEMFAYDPSFQGGVTVASADFDHDGYGDVVTGAGPGGGPHVKIASLRRGLLGEFLAYEPAYRGGVYVAAGDADLRHDDGRYDNEIVTGTIDGGPHVRGFNVNGVDPGYSFHAYPLEGTGVRVAVVHPDPVALDRRDPTLPAESSSH